AEDGIRAFHVTGVQTCALPILLFLGVAGSVTSVVWAATPPSTAITPGPEKSEVEVQTLYLNKDSVRPNRYTGPVKEGEELSVDRSEERRVGKECRVRRKTNH